jgi:hypothetical protein
VSCPLDVPGTTVTSEDTDRGAIVEYVTTGDVEELRTRVNDEAARLHGAPANGSGPLTDVPSTATVQHVDGGARLSLVPDDPIRRSDLQQDVRNNVALMQENGSCQHRG